MNITLIIILAAGGGLIVGFVIAWLLGRTRTAALETELEMTKAASEENRKIQPFYVQSPGYSLKLVITHIYVKILRP